MKLLLDTHIWIWSVTEPSRLSHRVRRALENRTNALWLSPVSIWQLIVLAKRGRVSLQGGIEEWVVLALQSGPFREAPLTAEVALATRDIRLPHNDPADMLLAATAKVFGLTLVTSDARLIGANAIQTMAND